MSHSAADPHDRSKRSDDDEDEDTPAERSLRKAGCLEHHYRVGLSFALLASTFHMFRDKSEVCEVVM